MSAAEVLTKLKHLGISIAADGDELVLSPGSKVTPSVIEEVRQHKQDLLLHLAWCKARYPAPSSPGNLTDIVEEMEHDGYVLVWSTVLQDLVAFYCDERGKAHIPPGFVPYSDRECKELFGIDKALDLHTLRLIHEGKRQGAEIVSRKERQ